VRAPQGNLRVIALYSRTALRLSEERRRRKGEGKSKKNYRSGGSRKKRKAAHLFGRAATSLRRQAVKTQTAFWPKPCALAHCTIRRNIFHIHIITSAAAPA
jgi:hypothetical protein